jgi:hypothetical protein
MPDTKNYVLYYFTYMKQESIGVAMRTVPASYGEKGFEG